MAYLKEDEEKQEGSGLNQVLTQQQPQMQQQAQNAPQEPEQPQQSSAPTMITSGQPSTAIQSSPAQKAQKPASGSFTNLKSYLQANQGNRLASAAGQRVQNMASSAQKSIGQAQNVFGQRMEEGSLKDMDKAVGDVRGTAQAARQVQYQAPQAQPQTAQSGQAQPQQNLLEGLNTDRFAEVINAQYQGPQNLAEAGVYEPTLRKVRAAQETIGKTDTAATRAQLLRDMFSQGRDYTRGQSALDSLLLNTSQEGVQQLQQKAKEAGNVQNQFEQAQNTTRNLATERAGAITQTREDARKAFESEQSAEKTATEQRLNDLYITPAKDAKGNLIPKLDASGKPMKDAQGNPVYQTQWDRLPEQLRNTLRNAPKVNKQVQQQELKKIDQKYGNISKTYEKEKDNLANLEQQLQFANFGLMFAGASMDGMGPARGVSPEEKAQMQANIDRLTYQVNNAKKNFENTQKTFNQYQKEAGVAKNMNLDQVQLSPEEAAILGIQSGEGLYGAGADVIKQGKAVREKLVSKDEVARQQALAQLAALDAAGLLSTDVKYGMDKAGTQSILDSLDTAATRRQLNELEKGFRDTAENMNITGEGSKKNKTSGKRYYATETANLADVLGKAGYNFDAPLSKQVGSRDVLANLSGSRIDSADPASMADITGISGVTDVLSGRGGRGVAQDYGNLVGTFTGANILTNALGMGNFGSAIGGLLGGGTSSKVSKSDAARFAREDLQKKLAGTVDDLDFYNRTNVVNNAQAQARTAALQKLLGGLDMTNAPKPKKKK
jgi:hypothetical protein